LQKLELPNPRPRLRIIISTFGCVGAIFVIGPNKGILNRVVEAKMSVVYSFSKLLGKMGVEMLNVGRGAAKNVFNRELKIMNFNERDKRPEIA